MQVTDHENDKIWNVVPLVQRKPIMEQSER